MQESLKYFETSFDLFTSPFIIISLDDEKNSADKISTCLYYNNAFRIEFLDSEIFNSTDQIADQIVNFINPVSNNDRINCIIKFSKNSDLDLVCRLSGVKSANNILSVTLEPLTKFDSSSWNNLYSNNSVIVYSTKPEGDYAFNFISDNVSEILGFKSNEFIRGNDFWDSLIEPGYKNYVVNSLRSIELTNEVNMIYPLRNFDGDYKWFEERAKLIRNNDGTAKEIIGMVINVNEQKLSFDNLKKTVEELKTVINTIPGLILVLDTELRVMNYSDSIFNIIPDKSGKDIKGLQLSELLPILYDSLSGELEEAINLNKSCKRVTTAEEAIYLNDSYNILINPIKGDSGRAWGLLVVMFNITDFVAKEKELQNLILSLKNARKTEVENNEKISSLINELQDSRQNLIETNNQKDKFFSIIAHDLRTPLRGFMQLTQILSSEIDKMLPEEVLELTGTMYESSQNIYKLLENLLDWSKIQRGIIDYSPITMQLSTLVMMNLDLMMPTSKQKRILMINDVPNDLLVFTDVNIINTIIRNLITNAIKFSFFDSNIKISAQKINPDFIEMCVSDEGVGMDEETIKRLFKVDTQITSKGTNDETGTGLGLILCKELVEINGGIIRVESSPGKGSDFFFTVPVRDLR
ncbi:MAG: PAS domain-containing sensor histidine kinase [Candidatus Kapabacteria bacterium]|nr:PAS domain-containing sensor histidine kinase [Candidatus Kapabacteria bacterium]